MKALSDQKLEVQSAREAATVTGWLDTGNYALNWAISGRFDGGFPFGHSVEISGDPSTGKSYLIARALAMVQAMGGVALVDDTEYAYNAEWMTVLGVDIDKVAIAHSATVKGHLDAANAFVEAFTNLSADGKIKGPGILACDSLAQLSTEHELETQLDRRDMTKAAELKAFFRIMGKRLSTLPVVHISTNHVIANIGNMFQKRTTPGGGGPKYYATVRLDLRSVSRLKAKVGYAGVICTVVVDKNRLSAPWKSVRMAIPFYAPISRASGLIPALLDLGVLSTNAQKTSLVFNGQKLGLKPYLTKGKFLQQDEEAERLIDMVPEILDVANSIATTQVPLGEVEGEEDTE